MNAKKSSFQLTEKQASKILKQPDVLFELKSAIETYLTSMDKMQMITDYMTEAEGDYEDFRAALGGDLSSEDLNKLLSHLFAYFATSVLYLTVFTDKPVNIEAILAEALSEASSLI